MGKAGQNSIFRMFATAITAAGSVLATSTMADATSQHANLDVSYSQDALNGSGVDRLPPNFGSEVGQNRPGLSAAIDLFEALVARGGWARIPSDKTLKIGDQHDAIPLLRQRLRASGDLAIGASSSKTFDSGLEAAVKRFQGRHGLVSDGVVGPETFRELNVSATQRLAQLKLNDARRRDLLAKTGEDHIRVNIADQKLTLVQDGRTRWSARVVVGKPSHATPEFSDEMEYIVLNPYWNIPKSIATREMLPQLRRDPGALARQNIFVKTGWGTKARRINPWLVDWWSVSPSQFPFRLQQAPGRRNALGRLKFMFPNRHNVYIHDTPAKRLFSRSSRTFSHGCVRVEQPRSLAAMILKQQGWTKSRIDQALATGRRKVVRLREPLPVHIHYRTAWVAKDGLLQFRRDIYGRDRRMLSQNRY